MGSKLILTCPLITEMYQMKRFIDIKRSPLSMFLLLSNWFVFSQLYS